MLLVVGLVSGGETIDQVSGMFPGDIMRARQHSQVNNEARKVRACMSSSTQQLADRDNGTNPATPAKA
jgi:hypothetical protein